MSSDYVKIHREELFQLLLTQANMNALKASVLDNWEWYSRTDWPDEDDIRASLSNYATVLD